MAEHSDGGKLSSVLLILVAVIGLTVFAVFVFMPPASSDVYDSSVLADADGEEVLDEELEEEAAPIDVETGTWSIEEMLENIRGGGVKKDGIPAIEDPEYISAGEVDFLDDDEPVFDVFDQFT